MHLYLLQRNTHEEQILAKSINEIINSDEYVSEYLLVKSSALPEVYNNVMKVKLLLQSGEVTSVNDAVKRVGMSRSAYYKYRDDISAWEDPIEQEFITIVVNFAVESDALSEIVMILSSEGNKLLNISQSLPRSGFTDVMLTCNLGNESKDLVALRRKLSRVPGVRKVEFLSD